MTAPEDLHGSSRPSEAGGLSGPGSRDTGKDLESAMRRANVWVSLLYVGLVLFLVWKYLL